MKNASAFLDNIKPSDDVVIIYNNDADGICSCVLIKKFLKMRSKKEPYTISQPMPTDKNLIKKIQTTLPNKIIFLDLAVDQQPGLLKKLGGVCNMLIIDHHQVSKDVSSDIVTYYNPRMKNPEAYQSTSYLVYKICSKLANMKKHLWIALIGMIGDYNLDDSKDVVDEARKAYSIKDMKDSKLSRISDMITATRATRDLTCDEIIKVMEKAESYEDLYKNRKIMEAYEKVENEMLSIMLDTENNSEIIGNLVLYNFKSKYNLRSSVSTKLSEKHVRSLVIVYEKVGSKIKLSARNQGKNFNVSKVLQKASRGLDASAGGHDVAAGATINEKDWERFKENLVSLLG